MTIVGSAMWCAVLAWFGQEVLGPSPKLIDDPEAMMHALKSKSLAIVRGRGRAGRALLRGRAHDAEARASK